MSVQRDFTSLLSTESRKEVLAGGSADQRTANAERLIASLRQSVVGRTATFSSPFGECPIIYVDNTASGRPLACIEEYINEVVLPTYGNTHTTSSICGYQSTMFREEARQIIKNATNCTDKDHLIFSGSGATAAIAKLVAILGIQELARPTSQLDNVFQCQFPGCNRLFNDADDLKLHQRVHADGSQFQTAIPLDASTRAHPGAVPVVLVGPYVHHSNLLPWREAGAQLVFLREELVGDTGIELADLILQLRQHRSASRLVVAASAASNITGATVDIDLITAVAHQHGALVVWDYATAAPHSAMDMNPTATDAAMTRVHAAVAQATRVADERYQAQHKEPLPAPAPVLPQHGQGNVLHRDAIVFSPHKFMGGPGTAGVLLVKAALTSAVRPSLPGGGSVFFVTEDGRPRYLQTEEREEGGTPDIIGCIRAGLVMMMYRAVGWDLIGARECAMADTARATWQSHPAVRVVGSSTGTRHPVVSFVLLARGRQLHWRFVSALLNDLFGIQCRGGCLCAGPYALRLLGLKPGQAHELEQALLDEQELLRPGVVRVAFPFTMSAAEHEYVVDAVMWVATHGTSFLPLYTPYADTGEWKHTTHRFKPRPRTWLSHISFVNGQMSYPQQRAMQAGQPRGAATATDADLTDEHIASACAKQFKVAEAALQEVTEDLHGYFSRRGIPMPDTTHSAGAAHAAEGTQGSGTDRQTAPRESEELLRLLTTPAARRLRWFALASDPTDPVLGSLDGTLNLIDGVLAVPAASHDPVDSISHGGPTPLTSPDTFPITRAGSRPATTQAPQPEPASVSQAASPLDDGSGVHKVDSSESQMEAEEAKETEESSADIALVTEGGDRALWPAAAARPDITGTAPSVGMPAAPASGDAETTEAATALPSPVAAAPATPVPHVVDSVEKETVSVVLECGATAEVTHSICPSTQSQQYSMVVHPLAADHANSEGAKAAAGAEGQDASEAPTTTVKPKRALRWRHTRPPKRLMSLMNKAVLAYDMIHDGDRLMLGLSGGKDSLTLLHMLLELKRRAPFKFDIVCATVDPQADGFDPSALQPYVAGLGVEYYYESQPVIQRAMNHISKQKESICSWCSRMKRGILYSAARRANCNVLVLAQHTDDLVESFMMSMFHNGLLRTMKANYRIQAEDLRVIRPLVNVRERELRAFAEKVTFPVIVDNCPACFSAPKERYRMKTLLASQEHLYPSLFASVMRSIQPFISISAAIRDEEEVEAERPVDACSGGVCPRPGSSLPRTVAGATQE